MDNKGTRNARFLLTSVLLATILTICITSANGQTFKVVYAFSGSPDGANPNGDLTMDAKGNLYGTTANGGSGPFISGQARWKMAKPIATEERAAGLSPGRACHPSVEAERSLADRSGSA